ncbi:MAG: porin family protein [Colwellia sp.]|nr:porin family protein [Colwellia sp.]
MNKKSLLPLLAALPMQVLADEEQVIHSPHTLFYGISLSDTDYSAKNKERDFDDGAVNEFGYRYQMNNTFSFDTRYLKSSSIGFKQVVSLGALDGTINYSALTASLQAQVAMTDDSYFYGNLGGANYHWDYSKQGAWTSESNKRAASGSGIGVFSALGAKYQWSKVELSIEGKGLTMGDVKTSSYGVGIGYRF